MPVDNDATEAFSHRVGLFSVVVIDKNCTTNALHQRVDLLLAVSVKIIDFEKLKEDYNDYPDFKKIMYSLRQRSSREISEYTF